MSIEALGDQIANLKLSEAVALKAYLKDKYGIEPAAGGAVMMAPATTTAVVEAPAAPVKSPPAPRLPRTSRPSSCPRPPIPSWIRCSPAT